MDAGPLSLENPNRKRRGGDVVRCFFFQCSALFIPADVDKTPFQLRVFWVNNSILISDIKNPQHSLCGVNNSRFNNVIVLCGFEFTLSAPWWAAVYHKQISTMESNIYISFHGHLGNTSASQQYDKLYLIKTTKHKQLNYLSVYLRCFRHSFLELSMIQHS